MIIACPKCTTRLKIPDALLGKIAQCPKCATSIQLPPAMAELTDDTRPSSNWYYIREGWFSDEEIGPLSDREFLRLVRTRHIQPVTRIRSPEMTANRWTNLPHVDVGSIEQQVRAREDALRYKELERLERERIDTVNRERLHALIRQAVADGEITRSEQSSLDTFAAQIGVSHDEVQRILEIEGQIIVKSVLTEILSDGIVSPNEEERLVKVATGMGITFAFDEATGEQLELAKLCWLFNNCDTSEFPTIRAPFRLPANESCFASVPVEWNEVTVSTSIAFGNTVRLKPFAIGDLYVTSSRLVFVAIVGSKSIRLSAITRIGRYSDGVLVGKTTGKSVFLRFASDGVANQRVALLIERLCVNSTEPIGAFQPTSSFLASHVSEDVPPVVDDDDMDEFRVRGVGLPRYTFRVVGEHIGNRRSLIRKLHKGDQLLFQREPDNPADQNAVLVLNSRRAVLGYLKREVAAWFCQKLDAGRTYFCVVHRVDQEGYLVVGVYEY